MIQYRAQGAVNRVETMVSIQTVGYCAVGYSVNAMERINRGMTYASIWLSLGIQLLLAIFMYKYRCILHKQHQSI